MRLRNVKNASEIISASPYIISEPEQHKGNWHKVFDNNNPIHIEIGMGKGKFIREMALQYPDVNFIGIEKYSSVVARCIQRIGDIKLPNLKLVCFDAMKIDTIFSKEIDHIYLNFSDPWPKDRHARRRLTSDIFLLLYEKLFDKEIKITQKTDNYNLYLYSEEQFIKHNYNIVTTKFNLDNVPINNITTEYEDKFLAIGNTIYKIEAKK